MLDGPFREIAEVRTEKEDLLVELAKRAVGFAEVVAAAVESLELVR